MVPGRFVQRSTDVWQQWLRVDIAHKGATFGAHLLRQLVMHQAAAAPRPLIRFVLALAALNVACGSDATAPPAVTSVAVSSDIGLRVAVGRTAQLTAAARDANGAEVPGVVVTWSSSATGVATVTPTGVVTGVSTGAVTLTATAAGVSGQLALQVRNPSFTGITAATNDPLTAALTTALTTAVRGRVQSAFAECGTGVSTGNFYRIDACIASVRAELGATDPTDRALLATLALIIDHVERLLDQ